MGKIAMTAKPKIWFLLLAFSSFGVIGYQIRGNRSPQQPLPKPDLFADGRGQDTRTQHQFQMLTCGEEVKPPP